MQVIIEIDDNKGEPVRFPLFRGDQGKRSPRRPCSLNCRNSLVSSALHPPQPLPSEGGELIVPSPLVDPNCGPKGEGQGEGYAADSKKLRTLMGSTVNFGGEMLGPVNG